LFSILRLDFSRCGFDVKKEKAKLVIKKVGSNGFNYEMRIGDVPIQDTSEADAVQRLRLYPFPFA